MVRTGAPPTAAVCSRLVWRGLLQGMSALAVVAPGLAGDVAPSVVASWHFGFIVDPARERVLAMGRNDYGQLGTGDAEVASEPTCAAEVLLPNATRAVAVAAGRHHSLFLMEDGSVYAAGRNQDGQLGDGSNEDSAVPVRIFDGRVLAVAAGSAHSLFLLAAPEADARPEVWSVGWNSQGQLGLGDTSTRKYPGQVAGLGGEPVAIAAGFDFSFVLTTAGEVFAFGNGLGGQLGDGQGTSSVRPVRVPLSGVVAVAAGTSHGIFLLESGAVFGTGGNADGQLGEGTASVRMTPTESLATSARDIFAGGTSSGIVNSSGDVLMFGSNRDGQLGLGEVGRSLVPAALPLGHLDKSPAGFREASCGLSHCLFLDDKGGIFAAGINDYGELGDCELGRSLRLSVVSQVSIPTTITATTTTTTSSTTSTETTTDESVPPGTTLETDDLVGTTPLSGIVAPDPLWSTFLVALTVSVLVLMLMLLRSGRVTSGVSSQQSDRSDTSGGRRKGTAARGTMAVNSVNSYRISNVTHDSNMGVELVPPSSVREL